MANRGKIIARPTVLRCPQCRATDGAAAPETLNIARPTALHGLAMLRRCGPEPLSYAVARSRYKSGERGLARDSFIFWKRDLRCQLSSVIISESFSSSRKISLAFTAKSSS